MPVVFLKSYVPLFTLLLTSIGCSKKNDDVNTLRIAVASNMQFVVEELVKNFKEETHSTCEVILGSSGKLTAQINQGAPFDVFLSANMKYPNDIFQKGLAIAPAEVYAYGKLVLWSLETHSNLSIEVLGNESITHIAMGNPKTAPYGTAARQALSYYFEDSLDKKLIIGESVSQTNQFIISKAVQLGFTAKSVVLSPKMKDRGVWVEINDTAYEPIQQGIILIKNEREKYELAQRFQDFLFSEKGKEILVSYGFIVNE